MADRGLGAAAWPAPGKINRFLHILGRRADGYHELQSVFQFLDWCDFLRFRVRPDGAIVGTYALPGVTPSNDLILRAARLLQAEAGVTRGVEVELRKNLPMGGGLGGGSSDAATTLLALNRLWEVDLPAADLARLGLQLGADVPVFIYGQAAWAEGVGERLTPLDPAPPAPWLLLLTPPVAVDTGAVFAAPELTRDTKPITIADFLAGAAHNDCEAVVAVRYPAVAAALDWARGFGPARMSGTGACVFVPFAQAEAAQAAARQAPHPWQPRVVRGLNRSPVLDRLAKPT